MAKPAPQGSGLRGRSPAGISTPPKGKEGAPLGGGWGGMGVCREQGGEAHKGWGQRRPQPWEGRHWRPRDEGPSEEWKGCPPHGDPLKPLQVGS